MFDRVLNTPLNTITNFFPDVSNQCHTQTYFHDVESVWVPKKQAQIFKNFINFFNFNQFNNCPFFLLNYLITLFSCLTSKSR